MKFFLSRVHNIIRCAHGPYQKSARAHKVINIIHLRGESIKAALTLQHLHQYTQCYVNQGYLFYFYTSSILDFFHAVFFFAMGKKALTQYSTNSKVLYHHKKLLGFIISCTSSLECCARYNRLACFKKQVQR